MKQVNPVEQSRQVRFLILIAVCAIPYLLAALGAPAAYAAVAVTAASSALLILRHGRRFGRELAGIAPRAAAEWAAGPAAAAGAYLAAASTDAPVAVTAAVAGVIGGFATASWAHRWFRTPMALLPDAQPGQVWWAAVPFEDAARTKDRPCLVVARRGYRLEVLMFTSQDKAGRSGFVPVPSTMWRQPRRSFLRTDRRITVRLEDLRRLECVAPDVVVAAAGLHR